MQGTFESFIAKERKRLHAQKDELLERQRKLEADIQSVEREMTAIDAYEAARQGKSPCSSIQSRVRPRRNSRRDKILEVVSASTDGLTRREVLEALGVKGDKSAEQSVSNALSALKKTRRLISQDGRYQTT